MVEGQKSFEEDFFGTSCRCARTTAINKHRPKSIKAELGAKFIGEKIRFTWRYKSVEYGNWFCSSSILYIIRPSKLNYQILVIPARTNFDDLQNL